MHLDHVVMLLARLMHDKAAASQHHLDNRNIAPLTTRRLSATVLKS